MSNKNNVKRIEGGGKTKAKVWEDDGRNKFGWEQAGDIQNTINTAVKQITRGDGYGIHIVGNTSHPTMREYNQWGSKDYNRFMKAGQLAVTDLAREKLLPTWEDRNKRNNGTKLNPVGYIIDVWPTGRK